MNVWREKYARAEGTVARGRVNIQFELLLLVAAHVFGPYFTVRASLIQARDAWNDDGTRLQGGCAPQCAPCVGVSNQT